MIMAKPLSLQLIDSSFKFHWPMTMGDGVQWQISAAICMMQYLTQQSWQWRVGSGCQYVCVCAGGVCVYHWTLHPEDIN